MNDLTIDRSRLVEGDPLHPDDTDVIVQFASLKVGKPVPSGWRVMTGNINFSLVSRVVYRYEVDGS